MQMAAANWFKSGDCVWANWQGGNCWFKAKITAVNRNGSYVVQYSDGDIDHHCPEVNIKPHDDSEIDFNRAWNPAWNPVSFTESIHFEADGRIYDLAFVLMFDLCRKLTIQNCVRAV